MSGLIDQKQLNEFTENDTEMVADLAVIFARAIPEYLARLNVAISDADAIDLRETSHQLKSQLNYFFCDALVKMAIELEEIGKQGTTENAAVVFDGLTDGIDRLLGELSQLTGLNLKIEED